MQHEDFVFVAQERHENQKLHTQWAIAKHEREARHDAHFLLALAAHKTTSLQGHYSHENMMQLYLCSIADASYSQLYLFKYKKKN